MWWSEKGTGGSARNDETQENQEVSLLLEVYHCYLTLFYTIPQLSACSEMLVNLHLSKAIKVGVFAFSAAAKPLRVATKQ